MYFIQILRRGRGTSDHLTHKEESRMVYVCFKNMYVGGREGGCTCRLPIAGLTVMYRRDKECYILPPWDHGIYIIFH